MNKEYWNSIKTLARDLRKNQTEAERTLWKFVRNRRFNKAKFFRQHPIVYHQFGKNYFFIADFYSAELQLVIELDGGIHNYQKDYDKQRDLIISEKGLKVIRISNEEVVADVLHVLKKIEQLTHPLPLSNIREGCLKGGES